MRNLVVAGFPVALILLGIAAYYYYYRRKINQRLNGDDQSASGRIVSPLSLAVVLLSLFTIINTTANRAAIEGLQAQIASLNNTVSQLGAVIAENRSDDYDYELSVEVTSLARVDDRYQALITLNVYPEISTAEDEMILYLDEASFPLARVQDYFTVSFSLFTDQIIEQSSLLITSAGRQYRDEIYLEPEKLYGNLFPYAWCSGNVEINRNRMNVSLQLELPVEFQAELQYVELRISEGGSVHDYTGPAFPADEEKILYQQIIEGSFSQPPVLEKNFTITNEQDVSIVVITAAKDGTTCYFNFLSDQLAHQVFDRDGRLIIQY